MAIELTPFAVLKAKELRAKTGGSEDLILKIGLRGGGCSGFMYDLEFSEPPEDSSLYEVIEYNGLVVYCDKKSLLFLRGTVVDYEETLMSSGFTFKAPFATRSCGCGESVSFTPEGSDDVDQG